MKKNNSLAAGVIALSLPLMMLAISTPGANAATVSSSVEAIDVCEWEMAGAPASLNLTSDSLYEGAALSVSSSISSLTVGLSGSQSATAISGTSTKCSFYNNREAADVTFELTTADEFTATYGPSNLPDEDMDFTLEDGGGLDIEADLTGCAADYTTTAINFREITAATRLLGLPGEAVENKYTGSASGSERCTPTITIGIDVKESSAVPAGAGLSYSFSGPSLIIDLDTTNVGQ